MYGISGFFSEWEGFNHSFTSNPQSQFQSKASMLNSECGRYTIAYDGNLFNVCELKSEFGATEECQIILNAFIRHGIDAFKKFNGAFAFTIFEKHNPNSHDNSGKLYLCRDQIGVKSMFYTLQNGRLAFASELKSLFDIPEIKAEIDIDSYREIFGIGPARSPGNGVFKDIKEVLPGNCVVYELGSPLKSVQYWKLVSVPHTNNYEQTLNKVRELVSDAIKLQMPSITDLPPCSFLSGGIDSSIVTALVSKLMQCETLKTFSFDFAGNDQYFTSNDFQPERDRPFVDKMLLEYRLNHTYLECDMENLIDLLYTAVDVKGLPGMVDIDTSLFYFCDVVSKNYSQTVAFTGECADELFGGYPWFYHEELLNANSFPWSKNLEMRTMFLSGDFLNKLNLSDYTQNRYHESLQQVPRLHGETPVEARRREVGFLTQQWFMQTLLARTERACAYSGLEARVPFADYRIAQELWNVPWEMKFHGGVAKGLLREAFADILPKELLQRKKSPFPKTYNPGYTKALVERLNEILHDNSSPILNLVERQKVLDFMAQPQSLIKPWFGQLMAGPQMLAYLIQVDYWLREWR
ncbi:MAG: asparagine synthase (glutamine-hydrolyzing) [Oscillospiraceae bacterium]|nr:asparagine synthase (glutamine-hydrolyzing) [Oscillospiraceae bacterium]